MGRGGEKKSWVARFSNAAIAEKKAWWQKLESLPLIKVKGREKASPLNWDYITKN